MKSIIQPFQRPLYPDCSWKPPTVKFTPPLWPYCNKKHLCLCAIGNGENRASKNIELDQQRKNELQFGIRIGGDSKETSSKVIGKKSIKGVNGLMLKRPSPNLLTNTDIQKLTDFPSSQAGSINNTGKGKSLELVRPVKRKEGKEAVSSNLTRLGSHAKTVPAEYNAKNFTDEIALRKPHAQNKAFETLGFVSRPIVPYFLSHKKEDKSQRHLEYTGLLRRPEAQATRIDDNSNKIPRDLEIDKAIIEDLSESKADNANAHDVAHKKINERGDMKGELKISAIRPNMPQNPHMDSHKSNRYGGHENYHEIHGKEDASSFVSTDPRGRNDFTLATVKTDKILKAHVNISGLDVVPPENLNLQEEKQCIQDCKEGADFKAESQTIQQKSSIGLESVKLKALRPRGSPRVYLAEENSVKRKSREGLSRHPLVNEISAKQSIHICSETDTGLDLPPCEKEFEEKTHTSDGPENAFEKILSHLIHSFPSDPSDGAEGVLDKKVHQSTLDDSKHHNLLHGAEGVLDKKVHQSTLDDSKHHNLLHEMISHASSRHTKNIECNVQFSDQAIDISQDVKDAEDCDWARAKILHGCGRFEEVELVSCSNIGFIVAFGSLLGLLPYRYLSYRKRPFPFEVWLKKMSDPLKFQKEVESESSTLVNSMSMRGLTYTNNEAAIQSEEKKTAVTAQESQNLINWYNQDRQQFLSSFLGQKTLATVTLVDRKYGTLIFSEMVKENQESIEKKESVMDKLNIGDIVTCKVARIGSFGVFVELEGVSAFIHCSELSWDPDWDADSHLKVGEVLKVKVCGLDRSLHRIKLSLKQLKPDPLLESLESILEDYGLTSSDPEHAELNTQPDSLLEILESSLEDHGLNK